jgi:sec-independent protein translocase protein TatC
VLFSQVLQFLLHPYCHVVGSGHACRLYVTGPLDGLSIRIKVAAYGGLLIASPVVLWQIWRFIVPGLRPGERRYARSFVTSSVLLFIGGAAVAFVAFPHALAFLDTVGGASLQQIYSPANYIGLLLLMMAAFGLTFELPVLLLFLQLAGVVTPAQLSAARRWAIVGLVALSAILTPSADPLSMLALAVPLLAFYELSILVGRLITRSMHS